MNILSAIFKSRNEKAAGGGVKPAGVVKDEDGWYYEESQNFSSSQSTIRIDQNRPGDWEVFMGHCMVEGLNVPARSEGVHHFFNGAYRWLRLVRDLKPAGDDPSIKVIGTYRDKAGREHEVHLGCLTWELTEALEGLNPTNLWGRIRLIRFPVPGRNPKFLIRFDLMQQVAASS